MGAEMGRDRLTPASDWDECAAAHGQEKLYTQDDLDFFSANADEYFEMANALRKERDRLREALIEIAGREWHDEGGRIAAALARDGLKHRGCVVTTAYTDPGMWDQIRLESGAYVWMFLCASDCETPWDPETLEGEGALEVRENGWDE